VALQHGLRAEQVDKNSGETVMEEKHIYKVVDKRELSLFVIKPADWKPADTRPAAVFFHGGGWMGGTPAQFSEQGKYLASRGMVCVLVEYRLLTNPEQTPEVCIRDAQSAMRWVRARAGALGVDPDRIASGGGSAGGHLAAYVGLMTGMDDPQDDLAVSARADAMLLFNPVFDNGPSGYGYKRVGENFMAYSPLHNVATGAPPSIVFFGDQDNLVSVETAALFKRRMDAAGAVCEVIIYEDMKHGFFNYAIQDHIPYYKTMLACDRFLCDLGWLKGVPTLDTGDTDLGNVRGYTLPSSRDTISR
jgi:acetyl esterase/lipase